ncbi:hypothetical protein [Xanthomonas translucens]|uniref:hypothetical protein n=1 Tax=Xanthomonas campestris pv. translucens TaxID=343 RepID=UPI00200AFCA2|nr:hypothetical protein [Xanthomonas translucens]UPU47784.1 hypothetical protein MZO50_13580 [Xanthomonas translucens pv. undulosa]
MSNEKGLLFERLRRNTEPVDFNAFEVPKEARASFYSGMGAWIEGGAHGFSCRPTWGMATAILSSSLRRSLTAWPP